MCSSEIHGLTKGSLSQCLAINICKSYGIHDGIATAAVSISVYEALLHNYERTNIL